MTEQSNTRANAATEQAVADCFEALLAAIRASGDEWRTRATEALKARRDTEAQECLGAIQHLTEAADEVKTLYHKWKDRRPVLPPPPPPPWVPPTPRKRPRSTLRVDLDGRVIEYSTAGETFARTIEAIGIERVARLGKILSGTPLIGTSKATEYQNQFPIGKFYVCTHSNTLTKKRMLDEIAAELGIPIAVEITSQ